MPAEKDNRETGRHNGRLSPSDTLAGIIQVVHFKGHAVCVSLLESVYQQEGGNMEDLNFDQFTKEDLSKNFEDLTAKFKNVENTMGQCMTIRRVWAMPNKWTFTIKPIRELLARHVCTSEDCWCDPFAGENSPAQVKNDLNGKSEFCMDALAFLKSRNNNEFDGVLFDPPYSITQAKQCYEGRGMDKLDVKPTSMQYWGDIKTEIARVLKPGGKAICFGWTSMGIGINRGFIMDEILLVPHGGSKNDTIVTVEHKHESVK